MKLLILFSLTLVSSQAFSITVNPLDFMKKDELNRRRVGFHGHSVGNGGDFAAVKFTTAITRLIEHLEDTPSTIETEKILSVLSLDKLKLAVYNSGVIVENDLLGRPTRYSNISGVHIFYINKFHIEFNSDFPYLYNSILHLYLKALEIDDTNRKVSAFLDSSLIYEKQLPLFSYLVTRKENPLFDFPDDEAYGVSSNFIKQTMVGSSLKIATQQIITHLKNTPSEQEISQILSVVSLQDLERLAGVVSFKVLPTPPKDIYNTRKDAVYNYPQLQVLLYEDAWVANLHSPYLYNLLLHEYLRILGIEDGGYTISRFLDSSKIYRENYHF